MVTKLPLIHVKVRVKALRISGFCRTSGFIPAVLLALLLTSGCSRPTPDLPGEATTQGSPTPFQGQTATDAATTSQASSVGEQDTSPPFQTSDVVPAGALLTVRLKAPLDTVSGSKTTFEALLDEAVTVDGNALIPRDAVLSGEIESAQVSKTHPDRGYLRLALTSVQIDGLSVPIQSASLYVRRQPSAAGDPITIRLEKGRRLTFRLREQVFLHPSVSKSAQ
jgi:hypothetical protein